MTVSYWQRQSARGESLERQHFDVAIIGAGICGISAALACEKHGASAIVLERHGVASGASGRNAGYLMRGMADTYAVASRSLGRETARAVWAWSEANLRALRGAGSEASHGFADRPSCLLAMTDEDAADLEASHTMLLEDGFTSKLLHPGQCSDKVWQRGRPLLGLVNQHDAVCDPVAMVNQLARGLSKTRIVELCEVAAIVEDGSVLGTDVDQTPHSSQGVRVRTSRGDVSASAVLVCTNAQASELITDLRGVVRPKRGQMVAVAPRQGPIELAHSYYLNRGDEYLRTGPSGMLLMGGARKHEPSSEEGDHGGVHPVVQERLEQWLRDLVTDDYQVVARWSGVMGFSPDGLPLVGPVDQARRVWVCAGFTGHGMSLGFLTAAHAVNAILNGTAVEPMFAIGRI